MGGAFVACLPACRERAVGKFLANRFAKSGGRPRDDRDVDRARVNQLTARTIAQSTAWAGPEMSHVVSRRCFVSQDQIRKRWGGGSDSLVSLRLREIVTEG